jgi:hypothetical protein
MFRFSTFGSVGGMLYPWWFWMESCGRISLHRMEFSHPSVRNIKPHRV